MKSLVFSATLLFALPLAAQTPPKTPPAPPAAAPAISAEQRAQFFKAQAFMIQANDAAEKARSNFQDAIAEMKKVCGEKATLQSNQTGDPVCVLNPVPEKK